MNLVVLSPEQEVFVGEVSSVRVPGTSGSFEILNHHAALVSSLKAGEVRIIDGSGNRTSYQIDGGFIEVLNNKVSVLVQGVQ